MSRRGVLEGAGAVAVTAAVASTAGVASRTAHAQLPGEVGHVTTSDGVSLYYLEAGSGKPILMIPGWSQTAEQFRHQLEGLSDRYRVIAVDLRGHGEFDKPDHGYKISRLAKDVRDMIEALDLQEVNILGHSMGSSVIWNYCDLYGPDRLAKLLLIDQMPMITSNPAWSEDEKVASGAIFTPQSLYETINALAGPNGVETTRGFIGNMVTKSIPEADKEWIIERNLRMPRQHAATLLYNHATQDWRDLNSAAWICPAGGRRPGQRGALAIAGVDRRAGARFAPGDLRGGRRRQPLHVHRGPPEIQRHRRRFRRLTEVSTAASRAGA